MEKRSSFSEGMSFCASSADSSWRLLTNASSTSVMPASANKLRIFHTVSRFLFVLIVFVYSTGQSAVGQSVVISW